MTCCEKSDPYSGFFLKLKKFNKNKLVISNIYQS